jgi:hypothetical protein
MQGPTHPSFRVRFTCTIWQRCPDGLFSLVAMCVSRFRNCALAERNHIGDARKIWGSQKPRATLRREVHVAQEGLEARAGLESLLRAFPVEGVKIRHSVSDPHDRRVVASEA